MEVNSGEECPGSRLNFPLPVPLCETKESTHVQQSMHTGAMSAYVLQAMYSIAHTTSTDISSSTIKYCAADGTRNAGGELRVVKCNTKTRPGDESL